MRMNCFLHRYRTTKVTPTITSYLSSLCWSHKTWHRATPIRLWITSRKLSKTFLLIPPHLIIISIIYQTSKGYFGLCFKPGSWQSRGCDEILDIFLGANILIWRDGTTMSFYDLSDRLISFLFHTYPKVGNALHIHQQKRLQSLAYSCRLWFQQAVSDCLSSIP